MAVAQGKAEDPAFWSPFRSSWASVAPEQQRPTWVAKDNAASSSDESLLMKEPECALLSRSCTPPPRFPCWGRYTTLQWWSGPNRGSRRVF